MQAHWSREDLPHWDKIRDADDMAGNGLRSRVIDIALDEVVDHLNANHPKSEDVRRVEAQRDTQKTKARRARRARDKWQAACEAATANAQMWMDEAIAQRQRADDLERSLADIHSTLEASNDAMVEAITEERDALDDRLAKVDVELSEALARAERAESLAEVAKATAHTHLETLVSMAAKRNAAPVARLRAFATECVEHGDMTPAAARMLNRILDGG
ncbi:hypothetical protein G6009_00780 [Dietzia sp. SLG510A3-30A2]|nr:hypothetical protein [Dietzia sp. SLG510A3-30A2]